MWLNQNLALATSLEGTHLETNEMKGSNGKKYRRKSQHEIVQPRCKARSERLDWTSNGSWGSTDMYYGKSRDKMREMVEPSYVKMKLASIASLIFPKTLKSGAIWLVSRWYLTPDPADSGTHVPCGAEPLDLDALAVSKAAAGRRLKYQFLFNFVWTSYVILDASSLN
jgi:hypothetical protein